MTLQNMATLANVMHDPAQEEAWIRRASEIYRSALGEAHPLTAEILIAHADVLWRLGRSDEAFEAAMLGERLGREHLRRTAQGLPEADALQLETTRLEGLSVALTVAEQTPGDERRLERVFDEVIRSRAVLLDEMGARRRLLAREGDSTLAALREAWVDATTRYSELALRSASQADARSRAALDEARKRADDAEAMLAVRSREARRRSEDTQRGLADVRAALPESSVLVRYVRFESRDRRTPPRRQARYLALVLAGRDAPVRLVSLGDAAHVDSLVEVWHRSLAQPRATLSPRDQERRYRRVAGALRQRMWDPLASMVTGQRRVFVVSDGSLQLLAFGSLPVGTDRYLVESAPTLHDLGSERDAILDRKPREETLSLLTLGGVDFEREEDRQGTSSQAPAVEAFRGALPDCAVLAERRFVALPNTALEVEDVVRAWRASRHDSVASLTRLEGPTATEAAFKRGAPQARAIHVATHGFLVGAECEVGSQKGFNPLMLSGVALAGANRRGGDASAEDGILTAEEVSAMDLSAADCIVLSACDTGGGSVVAGEGVFGLRRAFHIAGARNIVMSMWRVPDIATRRWMQRFYEARFQRGLAPAECVREASIAELRSLRGRGVGTLPTSWGAFIASGSGW
jgi:CHAT domain-containing protein